MILLKIYEFGEKRRRKGRTVLLVGNNVAREPKTVHLGSKEPFGVATTLCHSEHYMQSCILVVL